MLGSLESLSKGARLIAHGASILELQSELSKLQKVNENLTKRRQRKRKVLQGAITRTVE